jgi:hypothetical protein
LKIGGNCCEVSDNCICYFICTSCGFVVGKKENPDKFVPALGGGAQNGDL